MPLSIESYGLSDIGHVRPNNEDAWRLEEEERFFVLADGMGGHRAGEVAAKELVEGLCQYVRRQFGRKIKRKRTTEESIAKISQGIEQVNTKIFAMSYTSEDLRGMGTTMCFLFFQEQELIFGHVGDSRIYRFRDKHLELLTKDHSLLVELVDNGRISGKQAGDSMYKNILTKAIGTEPEVEATISHVETVPNDIYMLCSDGLTDMLSQQDIQKIMNHSAPLQKIGEALVEAAKKKGGVDNVTVLLAKVKHEAKDIPRQ